MKKLLACSLALAVFLSGCNRTADLPREVKIVPDVSASIDPEAEREIFSAIEDVVQTLHRGDSLTIIPITGDADAELQGRTLHYSIPALENRQAYDADLRRLRAQIKGDLEKLQADAVAHPGKHTDILGTIRIALRNFSSGATNKRLVVLSDFIQDDDQVNFESDPRLSSPKAAAGLATQMSADLPVSPSVKIILGRLTSRDFAKLPIKRRQGIDIFWSRVLRGSEINPDGTFALRMALTGD